MFDSEEEVIAFWGSAIVFILILKGLSDGWI